MPEVTFDIEMPAPQMACTAGDFDDWDATTVSLKNAGNCLRAAAGPNPPQMKRGSAVGDDAPAGEGGG